MTVVTECTSFVNDNVKRYWFVILQNINSLLTKNFIHLLKTKSFSLVCKTGHVPFFSFIFRVSDHSFSILMGINGSCAKRYILYVSLDIFTSILIIHSGPPDFLCSTCVFLGSISISNCCWYTFDFNFCMVNVSEGVFSPRIVLRSFCWYCRHVTFDVLRLPFFLVSRSIYPSVSCKYPTFRVVSFLQLEGVLLDI